MKTRKFVPPEFDSEGALRELYRELSLKDFRYVKSLIRIVHRDGGEEIRSVITTNGKGPDDAVLRQFDERWCGALYAANTSRELRHMGPEWALVFKIDCDRAMVRDGSIDRALATYVKDAALPQRLRALKRELEQEVRRSGDEDAGPRSRRTKKRAVSDDLIRRYGHDKEASAWIEKNKHLLDDSEVTHDSYKDPVLRDAEPLSSKM